MVASRKNIVEQTLKDEASAIQAIAENLPASLDELVARIVSIPLESRLILSAMGKTSFIAMKLSASFASVGVPSFFVHPAEAVHGDLGRITASDLVVMFSNSGDTPELIRLTAALAKVGCTTVAVTSGAQSYLARNTAVPVILPKIHETGPLGLAPTSSTTAMLAFGDALLAAVMHEKKVSREDFAQRHPGGSLGRVLLQVGEVMRTGESLCIVSEGELCRDVLHKITLTRGRPGAAGVIGEDGKLTGVFTDGDLRRCLEQGSEFLNHRISEVMTRTPKTIGPSVLSEEALLLMTKHQIDQLIVVDEAHRPLGLVDIQDIVKN